MLLANTRLLFTASVHLLSRNLTGSPHHLHSLARSCHRSQQRLNYLHLLKQTLACEAVSVHALRPCSARYHTALHTSLSASARPRRYGAATASMRSRFWLITGGCAGVLLLYHTASAAPRLARCEARTSLEPAGTAALQRVIIRRIPGDGSCLFRALAQGHYELDHGGTPHLFSKPALGTENRGCNAGGSIL